MAELDLAPVRDAFRLLVLRAAEAVVRALEPDPSAAPEVPAESPAVEVPDEPLPPRSTVPFGYVAGPDGTFLIHEEEAAVVRLVFDLYLKVPGTRSLAKLLAHDKVRNRKGKAFSRETINWMLRNAFYVAQGAKHAPIISEEVFEAVQKRLHERACPSIEEADEAVREQLLAAGFGKESAA